jgi:hypothetical protein
MSQIGRKLALAATGVVSVSAIGYMSTRPASFTAAKSPSPLAFLKKTEIFKSNGQIHTNNIASNTPIEDYSSMHRTLDGSTILAVYDGHAGTECASQLAKYLPTYVATFIKQDKSSNISAAIKRAFIAFDADLLRGSFKDESGNPLNPAFAGSCVAMTYTTPTHIYAAVTGYCFSLTPVIVELS